MTPVRIQRKRTKGWRMPDGAIYVGRPSRFGNRYKADDCGECLYDAGHMGSHAPLGPDGAVHEYRSWLNVELWHFDATFLASLRGRDLVCWCPLEDEAGIRVPCHADVLLELANA